MPNQQSGGPPRNNCQSCAHHTRTLISRALAEGDQGAWSALAAHFSHDIKKLVGTTSKHCRDDVMSDAWHKLFTLLSDTKIYTVDDVHAWVRKGLRNSKLDTLRAHALQHRRETALSEHFDLADRRHGVDPEQRAQDKDSVRRCAAAIARVKADAERERDSLLVMCIQVIELMFITDLLGERIDRAEACRRLDLAHELTNISPKLSKIRKKKWSPLHLLLVTLGPEMARRVEDITSKELN